MSIRPATLADVPRLVEMGQQQIAATYGDAVADNPAQLAQLATHLVTTPTCACFVAEQDGAVLGMIGLVGYAHHLSGVPTAGEVMWWVEPEARGTGLALLRRAERWAAETGGRVIQMIAPDARVGRLYERRGYHPVETSYQAVVTPTMTALRVIDDLLPDIESYRAATVRQPFGDAEPTPGVVFHGIASSVDHQVLDALAAHYPTLTPTLTFLRQSPEGQEEPNFIHTDYDMGDWSAIYYLTAAPAPGDGTTFWRWRETGALRSTATAGSEAQLAEWIAWRDLAQWEPWMTVPAQPNRIVLFPSDYFHSRALVENYGTGETARLIQVIFGAGVFPPEGGH